MLPSKFWSDLSWRDFAAADMAKVIAVLPVAATEQHGPHLPVGVDEGAFRFVCPDVDAEIGPHGSSSSRFKGKAGPTREIDAVSRRVSAARSPISQTSSDEWV